MNEIETVDLLVHNAGINSTGHFESQDCSSQERVIRLNLLAPLKITARMLEQKRLAEGASVVLVSSLSYFASYPGAATYSASKDALAHFVRSLVAVCKDERCRVLTGYPGPTRTAHAHRHSPDNSKEASRMAPEALADKIFQAEQAGHRVLLPTATAKLSALLGCLFPGLMEKVMCRVILEKFPEPSRLAEDN